MQKRASGNIMLLVLFIMFVSSLLGLLVSKYMKDMIELSGLFKDYYTTYFYAYGGLELGLSEINYRTNNEEKNRNPFGLEESLNFTGYTNCLSNNCGFIMTITSRSNIITNSTKSFASCAEVMSEFEDGSRSETYQLGVGDGFIIPLFHDSTSGFALTDYSSVSSSGFLNTLQPEIWTATDGAGTETYIINIVDELVENYDVTTEPTIDQGSTGYAFASEVTPFTGSDSNKNYLIIANGSGSVKDFCLELTGLGAELPTKYISVNSIANDDDATIAFGATKNNELPSYLIYGTINP